MLELTDTGTEVFEPFAWQTRLTDLPIRR